MKQKTQKDFTSVNENRDVIMMNLYYSPKTANKRKDRVHVAVFNNKFIRFTH